MAEMFRYSQCITQFLSCQLKSFFVLSLSSLSGALGWVQLVKICASWVLLHPSVQKASMRHASMKASVRYFFIHPFAFLCSRWPILAGTLWEDVEHTVSSCPHRCFLMMLMIIAVTYNSPWFTIKSGHSFLIETRGLLPCFAFVFVLDQVCIQSVFILCVLCTSCFFGKPPEANSWVDESSPWQSLSCSFRHFSSAELTSLFRGWSSPGREESPFSGDPEGWPSAPMAFHNPIS